MCRRWLRCVSLGFFGLLSGLLAVAWGVSVFSSSCVVVPQANAETEIHLIRGRLTIVHIEGAVLGTTPSRAEWLGAPAKTTDVLGAFGYEHNAKPIVGLSVTLTGIVVPIPVFSAIAALAAYLIHRRFRLTLAAWLTLLVIASLFLAAYAHPYRVEHHPSRPSVVWQPSQYDSGWGPPYEYDGV